MSTELLIEETAHEGLQPLLNGFLIIAVRIIITDLYTLQFGINKCLLCNLSTQKSGGFLGACIGLYASSNKE